QRVRRHERRGDAVADIQSGDLITALDAASPSRSHPRGAGASGGGVFTDAYDLFVIGIASALITKDWNLSSGQLAVLNSTMLAAAFLGAMVFGRYANVVGRQRVYWLRRRMSRANLRRLCACGPACAGRASQGRARR